MKKICSLLAAVFTFSALMAQENTSTMFNRNIHIPDFKAHPVTKHYDPQLLKRNKKNTNRITSGTVSSWFDYYNANYISGTGTLYAFNVYPDSNLLDPATVSATCDGYIWCHGIGMSFDPVDNGYYTPGGVTAGVITNADAYTIDEFSLLDKYIMNNPGVSGVDSEIVDLIVVDGAAGDGTYFLHWNDPTPPSTYTFMAPDDTPRSAYALYNPTNAATGSKNDCWDSITTPKQRYAIPLTAAVAADTNASGYHVTTFTLSSPLNVPAHDKVVAYVHFKSAVHYALGTSTSAANYCQILAGDPSGSFPVQSAGSYQTGLIAENQDAYGYNVFGGHDLLFTPFDFINPASPPLATSPFGFEVPCFSFGINLGAIGTTTYSIISHSISTAPATACLGSDFYITVTGTSPLLRVKTYFGDGATDSMALIAGGATSSATTAHTYSSPGEYTIKQVLYYNNTPQDSVSFSNEYLSCSTLPIMFYQDINNDCRKESTEPYNPTPVLVQVDSNSIPIDTISLTSGLYYQAYGPSGTIYSFRVIPGVYFASCPLADIIYDTIVSAGSTYTVKYYGLSCLGSSGMDLELNTSLITGRHMASGIIMLNNNYCTPENAVVTMNFSHKYIFSGSRPWPTSITGNTITWDFSSLSLASGVQDIHFGLNIPSGSGYLTIGDTVNSNYLVTPVTGDINPANNYCAIIDTITGSFDPNEMSVSPSGCIAVDTVTPLQYTINFMNVGNDTAFNIYVMDTLSDNVDPKSLRIVMASNTMNIAFLKDGAHNIVKFDFPQIDLLDSNVCPECSGAVIFKVNTMPGLPHGTTIYNRAGVFFDDNPVVLTNTVEDMMAGCFQASVNNNMHPGTGNITIFPSPATDQLTIKMDQGAYASFSITNSIGQQLIQQPLTLTQTNVSVSSLSPGLYYITFKGDNGTSVQKFIKL